MRGTCRWSSSPRSSADPRSTRCGCCWRGGDRSPGPRGTPRRSTFCSRCPPGPRSWTHCRCRRRPSARWPPPTPIGAAATTTARPSTSSPAAPTRPRPPTSTSWPRRPRRRWPSTRRCWAIRPPPWTLRSRGRRPSSAGWGSGASPSTTSSGRWPSWTACGAFPRRPSTPADPSTWRGRCSVPIGTNRCAPPTTWRPTTDTSDSTTNPCASTARPSPTRTPPWAPGTGAPASCR